MGYSSWGQKELEMTEWLNTILDLKIGPLSWIIPGRPSIATVCMVSLCSRVWLFVTLWTVACQAPKSMIFSRQEYWRGLLLPSPGNLPDPGIDPVSPAAPALQVDSLLLSHLGSPSITTRSSVGRQKSVRVLALSVEERGHEPRNIGSL